jgi:polyphosphate kinase 2 (PPK2 family)
MKNKDMKTGHPRQSDAVSKPQLKNKQYIKELRKLQTELCKLQDWVRHSRLRAIIIFEGRDGAGKGGVIKAIMERVSPRIFRLVALPAPRTVRKLSCSFNAIFSYFQPPVKS